jgi:protein-tyrosine phosphatase/nicotinamidase-related amidase
MSAPSILITQCLQNDFVQPIGRYDPLPNDLHVGHSEALRLLGSVPAEGPVARVMRWAHQQPDDELRLIHIRDWHDPSDPSQEAHLKQFGRHCIANSGGAEFSFEEPASACKDIPVVDSVTLNDFTGTGLAEVLAPYGETALRLGLIGVWTEAKITFLAYELRTRYPGFELGVCSALTASSSRAHHFMALDQLERILGVRLIPSVGEFLAWLGGADEEVPLLGMRASHPQVDASGAELSETDQTLIRYLFRDCRSVRLNVLDGGFSGNLVCGTESVDLHGHKQAPHVLKIGDRTPIGKERASFERIEAVLGNSAPQITDFADLASRGGIKYRYASMGGGFSNTFQKLYMQGLSAEGVNRILDTVFGEQLNRLYEAAEPEVVDLLEYYEFSSRWAEPVRSRVEEALGAPAEGETIVFENGTALPNVARFYERDLDAMPRARGKAAHMAYVHGDLNGANIIVDRQGNVWIIDFFHTHRGHVLRDLVKLENDLLYIFTPVESRADLLDAMRLTDRLMEVRDLGADLPAAPTFANPEFARAWSTIGRLRSFHAGLVGTDRDPLQVFIAQMRYAVHTLSFDESGPLQRRWALYTACHCAEQIKKRMESFGALRVDWVDARRAASSAGMEGATALPPGRVGLTILPGRKDRYRDLDEDLDSLAQEGIRHVVCLVPQAELDHYGVPELLSRYRQRGFEFRHLPVVDQKVCSPEEMRETVTWLQPLLERGESVLMHCVGGLGRSGFAAACWLRSLGIPAPAAISELRSARSPRAIESQDQEAFVRAYDGR